MWKQAIVKRCIDLTAFLFCFFFLSFFFPRYTESAWVQFEMDVPCMEENKIVAFPPWSDGVSIFISHPGGRRLLMKDTGLFIKGRSGGNWDSNELISMVEDKYAAWARLTEEKSPALKGLPKFRVRFMSGVPLDAQKETL